MWGNPLKTKTRWSNSIKDLIRWMWTQNVICCEYECVYLCGTSCGGWWWGTLRALMVCNRSMHAVVAQWQALCCCQKWWDLWTASYFKRFPPLPSDSWCILYLITKHLPSFKVVSEERQTPNSNRSCSPPSSPFTPVFIIRCLQRLQLTKSQGITEIQLQSQRTWVHSHEHEETQRNVGKKKRHCSEEELNKHRPLH